MTKLTIIKLITMYSLAYNIDPSIAISVCAVESGFNTNAIGITNDLGLFQLNPKSFPQYNKKQLLDPKLNIKLGIKYLAKMKKECNYKGDVNWLICYNMGIRGAQKIRQPASNSYIKKIKLNMKGI